MAGPTDQDPAATSTSPPPPAAAQSAGTSRPPLRRPREGRILAGVATGLADHLGIDVVIVRILIVVFAIVTNGLGILAYIAAAIFVPAAEPGAPRPAPADHTAAGGERDPLFWLGLGVLLLGALWLISSGVGLNLFADGLRGIVFPLVLIGFGLALWRAGDRRPVAAAQQPWTQAAPAGVAPPAGTPSPSPSVPSHPSASSEHPMTTDTATTPSPGAYSTAADAGGNPPPTPPWTGQPGDGPGWSPPPPPERRPRSLLTRVTLGIALVTLGVLWSLRVAGVLAIGWGTILAAALLVIGVGLLIGSVIGRARWLVLVGVLIAPVVVVAQLGPFPLLSDDWTIDSRSAGEIRSTPADLSELLPEYQLGAGSIRLDLRDLDLEGQDIAVAVDVGAGEIRVITPEDVEVVATARTGIGQVKLFDARAATGLGAGEQTVTFTPEGTPRGRITLELQTGLGEIRVEARGERTEPWFGNDIDRFGTDPDPQR